MPRGALIFVVILILAGCATKTIPFEALREPAWGYTVEEQDGPGRAIYIYKTRPACRLRGLDDCRQLALDRGGEFYWLISLIEGPLWIGSTREDACAAMRDDIRLGLRQPTSDCTRRQLLLE
jgi:hypothetical protein